MIGLVVLEQRDNRVEKRELGGTVDAAPLPWARFGARAGLVFPVGCVRPLKTARSAFPAVVLDPAGRTAKAGRPDLNGGTPARAVSSPGGTGNVDTRLPASASESFRYGRRTHATHASGRGFWLEAMTEVVREDAAKTGGIWEDEDGQEYEVGPSTVAEHRLKEMRRARLAAMVRASERGGLEDRP